MRSLRNTERVMHNPTVDKVLEIESRGEHPDRRCRSLMSPAWWAKMLEEGDTQKGILAAGQCMGLIRDIPTCRELLDRIMAEAEATIREKFAQVFDNP
jgi:NADH:quinone reductase (non-electrogenic)